MSFSQIPIACVRPASARARPSRPISAGSAAGARPWLPINTYCGERVKPILFVTGHAPAYRVEAFTRLHERENIELALFGGRFKHGPGPGAARLEQPHRHGRPGALGALAMSGRYRAVVCPTGGRAALLATWAGTRRARLPLILWASLWA